ncbi:hypothetical protein K0M31_006911 [Melipona bicolor]|uniref:Uncharacterized protein n=1 Tax=Melipona bicolor TaxID=60889 RepID=A0AA40KKQ6_9HYME|nr:hypothetical protein K0M31_006911 [Melipona bicolor]
MIYHKPTIPRFRIAERVSVAPSNRPIYTKQASHSSTCSLRSSASTPPCVNRIKPPLGSKGPSPVHTSTPARSGIQSPKPTINGSEPVVRQNSALSNTYDVRAQESHYDVVKSIKYNSISDGVVPVKGITNLQKLPCRTFGETSFPVYHAQIDSNSLDHRLVNREIAN